MKLRSPAVLMVIGVVATLAIALAVVMILLKTGGAKQVSDNAAVIGALVALGGVFTAQMVSISLEDRRAQVTRELEDRRAQEARELENRRAHEVFLQNYLEDIGELLIEKRLRRASPGDTLSTLVRAQTLSVLEGLDPDRKRIVLQFLYESGLILKDKPVVDLGDADLTWAYLVDASLSGANLRWVNLNEANLRWAHLIFADLSHALLAGANLSNALLTRATLVNADLSGADLRLAKLSGADLTNVTLVGPTLQSEPDMIAADLSGADLSGANLTDARRWTAEQLRAASSLEGATMPDGQTLRGPQTLSGPTFEDWLKVSERRKEEGENV